MTRSPDVRLLSQRAYAKKRQVSVQYINRLVREGRIKLVRGQIDPARADRALRDRQRVARRSKAAEAAAKKSRQPPAASRWKGPASATGSLTAFRSETEKWRAAAAKLEYECAAGALLPRAEVLEAERKKNATLRTRFRRLARHLAPALARAAQPAAAEAVLLAEIDRALAELAADPLGEQSPVAGRPSPDVQTSAPSPESRVPRPESTQEASA